MDMQVMEQMFTQTQAARYLNRGLRTLALWREKKYGPAFVRVGGAVMYRLADLQAFIERNRVVPGEKVEGATSASGHRSTQAIEALNR